MTVPKVGAKAAPAPLDPVLLGEKTPPGYFPVSDILKPDISHMDVMRNGA